MTRAVPCAPRWSRCALALAALLLVAGSGTRAHAHPDLDEAARLAGDLEFEAALLSFQAALASGTLTRDELIVLLSERAFVLHALRRQEELIEDFIWLSALAPDHRLDLRAPPDLTATWTSVRDQGRGPLKIVLSASASSDGAVHARASLTGTIPEGAAARLYRRRAGGDFERLPRPELHEYDGGEDGLALYADALALGGVVLEGQYNAREPLHVQRGRRAGAEDERGWASRHKGWLIGGAAVVAAAIVVTAVLVARGRGERSDETNLNPMVTF